MKLSFFLCASTLLLLCASVAAQTAPRTFKGGIVFGLNAAQVHGDELGGYDKLGITGGGRISVQTSQFWEWSLEMLYSQRGSRNALTPNTAVPQTHYRLRYLELPLSINYRDRGVRLSAGLAYSRLVSADITIQDVDETDLRAALYHKNDFNLFFGGGYFIHPQWLVEVRWARSFLNIVEQTNITPSFQYNVWLSFRGAYSF